MSGTMARLDLPISDHNEQLRSTVRRIEIQSGSIVVRFDQRANVLARWRAAKPDDTGKRDREIVDRRQTLLASGETMRDDNEQLILVLPVRARFRGGRAAVLDPTGTDSGGPRLDMALVKADRPRVSLAADAGMNGEVNSIEALSETLWAGRGRHTARTLNLEFLSPANMRAIIRGEQPPGRRLTHLLDADVPLSWREQEAFIVGL